MKFSPSAAAALCLATVGNACLLPEESPRFDHLQEQLILKRQANNNTGLAIGKGDRFDGGKTFPRGLGTQASETVLGEILSLKEIESAFQGLAKEYGFETFETPHKTYEKRTVWGGKIGGAKCRDKQAAYFNAGLHARERGSPDNLLYFLSDLLYANKNKIGVTYGGRSFTYKDVKDALSVGIVFLPVVNPDGVAYDQATNSCWRKNRNPADAIKTNPATYGVDLNRNFDFLWDFPKVFHPSISAASTNPASQAYRGRSAFSEPETKNVKWMMDTFSRVRWYMDIHSYTGTVLFGWGSDENQSRDKEMNFANPKYDGKRGPVPDLPDAKYGEYVSNQDWINRMFAGTRAANAADSATGRHYESQAAVYLYPTSGASDDYASSRELASGGKLNKVYGFTVEFGFGNEDASCAFYPTAEQYKLNMLETNSAFFEFLLSAKEIGLGPSAGC